MVFYNIVNGFSNNADIPLKYLIFVGMIHLILRISDINHWQTDTGSEILNLTLNTKVEHAGHFLFYCSKLSLVLRRVICTSRTSF